MARLPAPPDRRNPAPGRCAEAPPWRGPGCLQVSLAIRPPPGILLRQRRVPGFSEQPRPPGSALRRTPRLSPPLVPPLPPQRGTQPGAAPGRGRRTRALCCGRACFPPAAAWSCTAPARWSLSLGSAPPAIGAPRWIYEWGEEATCSHRRLELTAHCRAPQSSDYPKSIRLASVAAPRTCCCYAAAAATATGRKPAAFRLSAVWEPKGGPRECERARRGPSQCSGTVRFSVFLGLGGVSPALSILVLAPTSRDPWLESSTLVSTSCLP